MSHEFLNVFGNFKLRYSSSLARLQRCYCIMRRTYVHAWHDEDVLRTHNKIVYSVVCVLYLRT